MSTKNHLLSSSPFRFVLVAAPTLASAQAHAAPAFWGGHTTIAADTDVLTAGGFAYGYGLSNSNQAVNRVTFTGTHSTTSPGTLFR